MGSMVAGAGVNPADQRWGFWPLLPLYPYGRRHTVFSELIPGQLWSLEQLQGVYYVAVPVRLTVAKVPGGLMLVNPLPPTGEVRQAIAGLEQQRCWVEIEQGRGISTDAHQSVSHQQSP